MPGCLQIKFLGGCGKQTHPKTLIMPSCKAKQLDFRFHAPQHPDLGTSGFNWQQSSSGFPGSRCKSLSLELGSTGLEVAPETRTHKEQLRSCKAYFDVACKRWRVACKYTSQNTTPIVHFRVTVSFSGQRPFVLVLLFCKEQCTHVSLFREERLFRDWHGHRIC